MHTIHQEAFDVNRFMERQPEDTVLILKNHPFVKQELYCGCTVAGQST
ncbi:MAG: hypothetical protein ACLVIY_00085 [Anaerobutyricum soehngenii]